ncbi:uncharacterized protein LOC105249306 [Camponotus floridanus]|uniref:uncharacterized protein LOC105249306 n=1 Tax=Camponotus floridanus TaxID=104421 RepID=UPI00059E2799|nr:uncharacterized protein LOC105249306 [Camponotus floridanus]
MRLLCLSLALAIIYIMAIMHSSRVEARATTSPDLSSSSSSESWEIPPKPPKPPTSADLDEDAALARPIVNAIVYWTGQAFETQFNNSMHMADDLKNYPQREEAVQEYLNKTLTW